jgi:hypothetical protein
VIVILVATAWLGACGSTVSPARQAIQSAGGASELGEVAGPAASIPTDAPGTELATGGVTAMTRRPSEAGGAGVGSTTAPERGPIKVGILSTNNDAAPSAGIDNGNTFSGKRAFEGFVAAYNKRGGLAGRRIVPVYVEVRSSSTTLPADLQAACDHFVNDEKVAVVLSSVGLYSEAFSQCLAKARTPQIAGDYALGDATSLAQAPSFFATSTMTIDDRMRILLERGATANRLRTADKLGVVIEGCPFNTRAYTRTVVPTAKRLGLTITDHIEGRCFESFDDFGGLASDMAGAVLRLRGEGVTKVVFVSGSIEGNLILLFATAAESQGWHPGYAITSTGAPVVQEANTPKAQLANAFGLGWLPTIDTTQPTATSTAGQGCLRDLTAAGVSPASGTDRYFALSICDTFAIYDAALRATFGTTDPNALARAIASLGNTAPSASTYGGTAAYAGGRRTGAAQGRLFAWSAACDCFDYTGGPFSLLSD